MEIAAPFRLAMTVTVSAMIMKYISNSPAETKDIGFRLGKLLRQGDVVGLYGELGAGKTTMVKGIADALGVNERDIVSASFTIIAEYNTIPPFSHIDLYRIEKYDELDELGLWDQVGDDSISVIEWAEKAEKGLPEGMIKVRLKTLGENVREITIEGGDEKNWNNL
jgi:tRNA threonylcarbamoyladenosine biosynthesis protein TsaE